LAFVGLALSAFFIWLAFRNLAPSQIARALGQAELWPWIPLAMLAYLLGHAVRGLRLRRLVSTEADLPLATATSIVVLGYAVNNVLPARLGEVARAGLLSDRMGSPFTQSLSVTLLERILDGWTTLLLLTVGIALVPEIDQSLLQGAYVAAGIFGTASLGMLVVALAPNTVASIASRVTGALNPNWQEPVVRRCLYVARSFTYVKRPGHAAEIALLSLVVWIVETMMFVFVMPAFGLPARFDWALLALGATNLGTVMPSTPGFIGPYHYLCMKTLVWLGVASVTASAYAITVHAVFYVPITLWGLGVVMRYGIELRAFAAGARDATKRAETMVVDGVLVTVLARRKLEVTMDRPSPIVRSLTESLIPAASDGSAPPAEVTERVATFVQGQLDALPGGLRLMLRAGLFGFRLLVFARYLRGFSYLPLERRRSIASAWAYGRYELPRKLFRAIRSLTLFRYYEEAAGADGRSAAPRSLEVVP
jgi:uncharacterized protein (TIRG00374 family)